MYISGDCRHKSTSVFFVFTCIVSVCKLHDCLTQMRFVSINRGFPVVYIQIKPVLLTLLFKRNLFRIFLTLKRTRSPDPFKFSKTNSLFSHYYEKGISFIPYETIFRFANVSNDRKQNRKNQKQ